MESLILLSRLREERHLDLEELAKATQQQDSHTRATLERLIESGLVDAYGTGRSRTYTLSAQIYQKTGQWAAYIRQAGFDVIQQEQMVLKYIDIHGKIARCDVIELCRVGPYQATRLLAKLTGEGKIQIHGKRRHAVYKRN